MLPFGDPAKWAGIPKEHAYGFSCVCLDMACDLFHKLDTLNNRGITPVDLLGVVPRVSVPMTIGSTQMPSSNMPISDFLSDVRQELS